MKCENCGKNEVTFVYRSNINGRIEEHHLCSDCAEKLGYSQKVASQSQRMMHNFWDNSLFDDFFTPMPSLLGHMNRMLEDPFEDLFAEMPALGTAQDTVEETKVDKKSDLVSEEDQSWFAKQRQLNALKIEMKKAIHQENFERAAELRDQIHELEKKNKTA